MMGYQFEFGHQVERLEIIENGQLLWRLD